MTSQISTENTNFFAEVLEQLRNCSEVNIQSQWFYHQEDLDIATVMSSDCQHWWENWTPTQLNEKGNVSWDGGKKLLWLAQKLVVPQDLNGYDLLGLRLKLGLLWWADSAQVYVNSKLVVEGDLFDCSPRVLISTSVKPGDEFFVALRLVSPGHCDGALVKSFLVYESGNEMFPEPGFVADELEVVRGYLEVYEPGKLDVFLGMLGEVTNRQVAKEAKEFKRERKREELDELLRLLRDRLVELEIGSNIRSKVSLLGHAHLDMAWLWTVSDTWNAAQSTFESVLKLQEDFSELIFCHSTPALYAWVEENRPDLFAAIQKKVAEGVWEVLGGFWIEPELNLISGESLARQLLYGQRYVLEKFGNISPIVWVPDTFGFCWTLPQFMQQGGIEYFVTQKLRWNDTNKFPHGVFWWESPDGSKVLSLMSAPVGEGVDAVKMASYAREWEQQTGLNDALWLPGVGDHGGGPTRDMLEIAQRWQKSPFFPKLEFTTAENYLNQIQSQLPKDAINRVSTNSPFPTWNDELYLEFHRGCYTTHGEQKRFNRRGENLLYEAELFAALSTIVCGRDYPKVELETAWKNVLFNQFHDILPGSSITEVYQDSRREWDKVERTGTEILQQSLKALASQIKLPQPPQKDAFPIFVFNSLNWKRSQVVSVELPSSSQKPCVYSVYNSDGELVASQLSEQASKLVFLAKDVSSVGYRVFWLCSSQNTSESSLHPSTELNQEGFILENEFLRVTVDEQTGNLSSVFDKVNQTEVLNGAGNELQAFGDSGQYWDAWNIDPNYAEHPLPPTTLKSIQYLEKGYIQSRIRVVRQLGNSEFCQDYILQVDSPLLKISTTANWQETHVMVKAAFPLNLEADFATYEIPCGAINRPTKPQTPTEKAKWEVPALRWANLENNVETRLIASNSDNNVETRLIASLQGGGVSLLNDCKYGYDAQPNQLRLTLLRSPKWPDPEADKGSHQFTYALYPHAGNWQKSHATHHGYELNIPLQVVLASQQVSEEVGDKKSLPHMGSFINLSADNLILMALKQSEDNSQKWVLRCYESHGETAELSLTSDLDLKLGEAVDLLERPIDKPQFSSEQQKFTIAPWKITSFLLGNG
ncbi:MAG: alpha-mannosidase [Scytonematopsis contorta HA4267-MV1]|jgi:alpha-mannosidase|nr:alpha-mannosidase [Scytonematopsis contorta HA4267-MV1]